MAKVKAGNPTVFVGQFGDASANKALSQVFADDFKKAESLSLPITLIILVLAFGALVAAGVPLLLGLTAVMATLGLVAIPSQFVPMDDTVSSVVLLVGLAVGVDYTLFYLRREREEKARGASKLDAVHTAAATSGRAVLVSGFTVMVAMAGMFFAGGRTFTALGVGAIMVVAVAMIGSVTVVPAVLAWLGDRIEKGRVPVPARPAQQQRREPRVGRVLTKRAQAPGALGRRVGRLLVVLALPAFGMHTVLTGTDDLPRKLDVMKVYDREQAAFPGGQIPAVVAIEAKDVTTPQIQAAVKKWAIAPSPRGTMNGPLTVDVSADKTSRRSPIPMRGDGTDEASADALATLRGGIVDQTVGSGAGRQERLRDRHGRGHEGLQRPHEGPRADRVRLRAVAGLPAAAGDLPLDRHPDQGDRAEPAVGRRRLRRPDLDLPGRPLRGPAGLRVQRAAIVSWLPLFLFVILFGLSMDYHVFILSRIREAFDRGMKTEDAVALRDQGDGLDGDQRGDRHGRVFAIFATLSSLDFKMMGVGLSVAILIDATLVRAVLLPATMKLLGDWNWYLPKGLHWLPRIAHEPVPEPAR